MTFIMGAFTILWTSIKHREWILKTGHRNPYPYKVMFSSDYSLQMKSCEMSQ
jgi:hypothetical protein